MTKRLTRSADDRWISGVCGGIAEYAGIDANLVRLLTVLIVLLGVGTTILLYVAAWIIMPNARDVA